jgi:hypothetical protein
MTPTPAPLMMAPVVCASSIARLDAMRLAEYEGPYKAQSHFQVLRDGSWALVSWNIGEMGGQSIYRLVDDRWCPIANGGGTMGRDYMERVAGPVHGARLWAMWNRK